MTVLRTIKVSDNTREDSLYKENLKWSIKLVLKEITTKRFERTGFSIKVLNYTRNEPKFQFQLK